MTDNIYVNEYYKLLPPNHDIQKKQFTRDARTGINVLNTEDSTLIVLNSLDWYGNYLEAIQKNYDKWQEFHYFDLGLVPVAMGPVIYQQLLDMFFHEYLSNLGVKVYSLRPLNLLRGAPLKNIQDIWVSRKDITEALGVSKTTVQFSIINDFIRRPELSELWRARWLSQ